MYVWVEIEFKLLNFLGGLNLFFLMGYSDSL